MKNKQFGVLNNGGGSQSRLCKTHKQAIVMISSLTMLFTTATIFPDNTFNLVEEITASAEETDQQETNVVRVTIDGVESFYSTLAEAWSAVQGKTATVTLLADTEITESLNIDRSDTNITFQGGDFTLSVTDDCVFYVEYGKLTIESGTILANSKDKTSYGVWVSSYASVDIQGGTIRASGRTESFGGHGVYFGYGSSNVTISEGVEIYGEYRGIYMMEGTCIIKGGTISSDMGTLYVTSSAKLQISGGSFNGGSDYIIRDRAENISRLLLNHDSTTDETHYAFYSGETPMEVPSGEYIKGDTITVKECTHMRAFTDNNDGTHSLNCQYCGCTKEEECTYGEYQHDNTNHWLTCEVCGGKNTEEHKLTHTEEKEPTCTENGNIAYWKCDDCGTYFSDENGETEINQSETVISATGHKYSDGKCTECGTFEDGMGAHLAGHSISLDGNIGVNFYMELDESVVKDENAYMQFTLPNGRIQTVNVSQAKKSEVNGKQYYVFPCKVAAKEMQDKITAQMITSDGEGTVYEYSVKEYADYITSHSKDYYDDTINLVEAMMNYGNSAKAYFRKEDTTDISDVTANNLVAFGKKLGVELPDGITYYGSSLLLESNTTVRHYFKVKEDMKDEHTFTGQKNGYYYTDITGISAANLGTPQTTTIGEWSISYSPMSYAYDVLNSDTASGNLKNLVKALYLYNQAAEAYQNNGGK